MYRKAHNCVHIEADMYKKCIILYISKLLILFLHFFGDYYVDNTISNRYALWL